MTATTPIIPENRIKDWRIAPVIGRLLKSTSTHSVDAFFVLLYLLKGQAKCFAQLLLTHAKHSTPLAHAAADVNVDGAGACGLMPWHC